jgi:diguanylate cyclase (GGDEF)-like protein
MEQSEKRRQNVFFTADLILMLTAFIFVYYNIVYGNTLLGIMQGAGGVLFISLAALVYLNPKALRTASWIFVVLSAGFMLALLAFSTIHITNLVWTVLPYFLAMFLLGVQSGKIVGLVYLAGSIVLVFVRFTSLDPSIEGVNQVSISMANVFAFVLAWYYENARSENEKELLVKNREIEIMSHHDGLTGLFNRRFFDRALHQEFHRAKRERQPLTLIILDIDFFKSYNDALGHLQGDACLGEVAEAINASITRSTDTATRYGGEEVAVLLPNTDMKGAMTVAERIRQKMEAKAIPHPVSSISSSVTLSMGVAQLSQEEDWEQNDLIRRADRALYASKAGGRNRITCA